MMLLDEILEANTRFLQATRETPYPGTSPECKYPTRRCAIFSCMDARLSTMITAALGLENGEAVMIRNAGNCIYKPFGSAVLSLMIGIFELGVTEVFVVGHEDCGVAHSNTESLVEKMLAAGISPEVITMVKDDLSHFVDSYEKPSENLEDVVQRLRSNPLIPKSVAIHGLIIDPRTGALTLRTNGYDALPEEPGI